MKFYRWFIELEWYWKIYFSGGILFLLYFWIFEVLDIL